MPTTAARRLHVGYVGSGTSYHVAKWLPALAEQNVQVSLFTFNPPAGALPGVEVEVLTPPFARWRGRLSWFDFLGPPSRLRSLFQARKVDAVIGSYATNYGAMAARAARGTGLPLVIQTWTRDVSVYPTEGIRRAALAPLVRRTLQAADLITTDGQALADYTRAAYPTLADRVVSVRWGIRLNEFDGFPERRDAARDRLGIRAPGPVVTSGRGTEGVYRPVAQLEAFKRLAEERPETAVVVLTLGHTPAPGVAERLEALDRLPNAFVFDRFLSREEMADVWFATDLMVSIPEVDGISESILEAMYCGAIPVASDIPSNRSFLCEGEASGLFVPDSARGADGTALADALTETLLQSLDRLPALRQALVASNRRWVAREASIHGTARFLAEQLNRLVHAMEPTIPPARVSRDAVERAPTA